MAEKGDDRMTGDTILLVDTDLETEEKIVSILEAEGYIVFASEGSKVSAEIAEKFRPALIFLRPLSPNAAGFAVCRAIHTIETLRDVPVVILASLKGPIDPRFTDYYGIVDFLKLTFTPEELIEKTAAIVVGRRDENISPAGEETRLGEVEVRAEQEVSDAQDETDQKVATVQITPAEDKNETEPFKEEWHAEGEKATSDDRPVRADKKYTAQQYEGKWSKKSTRKGPIIIVVTLIAIIAAGLVLYFAYELPEDQAHEVRPSPETQKPKDVVGNKLDVPSPQPPSVLPPTGQKPESTSPQPAKTFYAAQVGAFKTDSVAEALAQKLRLKGYEAYVQKGTAKDTSDVYRVLIGRFEKRKEAVTLAVTVGAKEKMKTTVFQGK